MPPPAPKSWPCCARLRRPRTTTYLPADLSLLARHQRAGRRDAAPYRPARCRRPLRRRPRHRAGVDDGEPRARVRAQLPVALPPRPTAAAGAHRGAVRTTRPGGQRRHATATRWISTTCSTATSGPVLPCPGEPSSPTTCSPSNSPSASPAPGCRSVASTRGSPGRRSSATPAAPADRCARSPSSSSGSPPPSPTSPPSRRPGSPRTRTLRTPAAGSGPAVPRSWPSRPGLSDLTGEPRSGRRARTRHRPPRRPPAPPPQSSTDFAGGPSTARPGSLRRQGPGVFDAVAGPPLQFVVGR